MPIHPKPLPQSTLDALQRGLAQTRGVAAMPAMPAIAMNLTSAHAAHWPDGLPQETFNLGLDAVVAKRGLGAAEATGWHVLLGAAGRNPTVSAELHSAAGGDTFSGLHFGPFGARALDAFRAAEAHPTVRGGDYVPRMLRVPALFVVALWLKHQGGGDDIVIPLEPVPPGLTAGRHYTAAEFADELHTLSLTMGAAPPPSGQQGPHAP